MGGRSTWRMSYTVINATYISQQKNNNQMPKSKKTDDTRISGTRGRPKKSKIEQAFLQVVKGHGERDAEQVTVNDLVREMEQICGEKCSAQCT